MTFAQTIGPVLAMPFSPFPGFRRGVRPPLRLRLQRSHRRQHWVYTNPSVVTIIGGEAELEIRSVNLGQVQGQVLHELSATGDGLLV